jgi:flavodoxin
MRVLVTFGSKRGGTEGLAQWLAASLSATGHDVDVRPAYEPDGLELYDAVIVGGALYANRWHKSARRFVQRHADELSRMPVWFFSSGPLDDRAAAMFVIGRRRSSELFALAGGLMLVASAAAIIVATRALSWHQTALLTLGLGITALAFGLHRMVRASVRAHLQE